MTAKKPKLYTTNEALENRENLQKQLPLYSSSSKFEEDIWVLDKLKKAANLKDSKVSLYFASISTSYKEIVKYFLLVSLSKGKSYFTISTYIFSLGKFFKFIYSQCDGLQLNAINKSILMSFEIYLRDSKDFTKSTKESIWSGMNMFFKTMALWEGMPKTKVVSNINPFSRTNADRLNVQKYVPINILDQIDKAFYDADLKHHIKTIYWICRLIPSRINEVTTVPIDCLKKYRENEYTLTLHMYKQNGGYIEPELRVIHLKYKDMGKYLVDLIEEQKKIALNLQERLPIEKQGFLFTYKARKNQISLLNAETVRECFNDILKYKKIVGENNEIYKLTPHQLRHNAITDRIYEGFSLLEIRDMTAHKSNSMLEGSYIHPEKKQLNAIGDKAASESLPAGGVYFKGKIINAENPIIIQRLLAKPRAHKIGRLGICSDITGCKNDMFECFNCSFFVPNADELDYFKEQVQQWEKKMSLAEKNPLLKENAEYNLNLSKKIVEKIQSALEEGEPK